MKTLTCTFQIFAKDDFVLRLTMDGPLFGAIRLVDMSRQNGHDDEEEDDEDGFIRSVDHCRHHHSNIMTIMQIHRYPHTNEVVLQAGIFTVNCINCKKIVLL